MKVCLISAALPPALDGIGDYTSRLAAELAKLCGIAVMTGMPGREAIEGCDVVTAFDATRPASVRNLVPSVAQIMPDWVVLQYCPFSYGRWGWNPYLPLAVGSIRRHVPKVGVATTVHEPMAWPVNWRLRTMNLWQAPQLRAISRRSDLAFLVVDGWRRQYRGWLGSTRLHHLPVGSNIAHAGLQRSEARHALGLADTTLVVTIFGQGHHSQQWELVAQTCRRLVSQGRSVEVLHLGPKLVWLDELFRGVPVRSDGYLPGHEVSRRLSATDVFLAPFADGVSTRRTTLMAALQHGLPVVGTRGEATDNVLTDAHGRALVLTPCDDDRAFSEAVKAIADDANFRAALGEGARSLYEEDFSWPVIARKMMSALEGASPKGP